MAFLSISLLGPIHLELDGRDMPSLKNKPQVLLSYLAVESSRPHSREVLGNFFWPNGDSFSVSNNLRQALWMLNQVFEKSSGPDKKGCNSPPFLLINRETVQFNPACSYWLDVDLFLKPDAMNKAFLEVGKIQVDHLIEISNLYKGNFMEGISIKDNYPFEEWVNIKQEQISQGVLKILRKLTSFLEANRDYSLAQLYARRQIEIDPYNEESHRQLIRILALAGQRNSALVHYENWCNLIEKELGMQPAEETAALKAAVQEDILTRRSISLDFLDSAGLSGNQERFAIPFCGRNEELARLDIFMKEAISGKGRVVIITGATGSGKTTLMQEFSRRTLGNYPELIPLSGACSTIPEFDIHYLPFREIFKNLCGNTASPLINPLLFQEQGLRVSECFPDVIRSILKRGPDLLNAFSISIQNLAASARTFLPPGNEIIAALENLEKQSTLRRPSVALSQAVLLEQYVGVLQAISNHHPLLLVIDDLHFKNPDTNALFFFLGKRLARCRILLVAALQPVEEQNGDTEAAQMMDRMIYEFQRDFGDIQVDLDQAKGRDFIQAYLESLPNSLSSDFVELLYHFTGGQALFMVELLRSFQESGFLVQDHQGRWIENQQIKWEKLPARIEAVIAKRLSNLPEVLRRTLNMASVEGESFTAEVLTKLLNVEQDEINERLRLLSHQYYLVAAEGVKLCRSRPFSHYRFRHSLFQIYLSGKLDMIDLAVTHQNIGLAMEELLGWGNDSQVDLDSGYDFETITRLVYHFDAAQNPLKTARYLLILGKLAYKLLSIDQAIAYFTRALAILEVEEESVECTRLKIDLNINLGDTLGLIKGWGSAEQTAAFDLALKLCRRNNTVDPLSSALYRLAHINFGRGDFRKSHLYAEEFLHLAEQSANELWSVQANLLLGQNHIISGNFLSGKKYLEKFLQSPLTRELSAEEIAIKGIDPQSYGQMLLATTLIPCGYLDQAQSHNLEGLENARISDFPHAANVILIMNCMNLYAMHYKSQEVQPLLDELMQRERTTEVQLGGFAPWIRFFQGKAMTQAGDFEGGINLMTNAIQDNAQIGSLIGRPFQMITLAEALLEGGRVQTGLEVIFNALREMERLDGRFFESNLYRLKGDFLLFGSDAPGLEELTFVEDCYQNAIQIAQRQKAKLWELQAVISLARLRQYQGRIEEARQVLEDCSAWFTEGFNAPDLVEARRMLQRLGVRNNPRI